MKAKPVQIAIIVIGLLVGIVGIVLAVSKNSAPKTANSVMLVDMKTGELFKASTVGKTLVLPMKNPDTGERTMMRVEFDAEKDGYFLSAHHMDMLSSIQGELIGVDRQTGKVSVNADIKPKTLN